MEALHARLLADSADADALLPHRTLVMQTAVACQRRLQAEERSEAALRELANLDPAVAAAERLVRWASAVAAAHRPGATLAINCIGDVDDAGHQFADVAAALPVPSVGLLRSEDC